MYKIQTLSVDHFISFDPLINKRNYKICVVWCSEISVPLEKISVECNELGTISKLTFITFSCMFIWCANSLTTCTHQAALCDTLNQPTQPNFNGFRMVFLVLTYVWNYVITTQKTPSRLSESWIPKHQMGFVHILLWVPVPCCNWWQGECANSSRLNVSVSTLTSICLTNRCLRVVSCFDMSRVSPHPWLLGIWECE